MQQKSAQLQPAAIVRYAAQNPSAIKWLACNVAAAIVALLPVPAAPYAGAVTVGAVNAGFYSASASKKRVAAAEQAGKLNCSKFESDVTRLNDDKKALDQFQQALATKETQLTAVEASLKTQQVTMRDRMSVEAHKEAQAKVDTMQARLEAALSDKAAMQATYQEKSTAMAKNTGLIVSKVQQSRKDLGDVAAQAIATGNEVLAKERQQVNQVLENLSRDIKAMAADLAAQKELVVKLQAPKQFKFKSFEADVANEIQAFLSSRGVVVGCDSIGKVHYGLTPIYFEAINCDLEAVKKQLEALQLSLGLSELPTAEIEKGKIKLTVQLSEDRSAKPVKDLVIVDPPLSALESAINDSIHLRIVAQSGSGKTVLLGNLINYLTQQVSSDYVLSDPKVTAPENWGNLKPDYYSRECLGHFFGLTETCLARIDEAAASVKATNELPDFEMQFHVIDELEFLYGLSEVSAVKEYNSKLFKINGKSMLKVGREHKMKLLFVTQSPLPSDLNFRRNDFENCSSIFLGSQISAALNSTDADGLLKDVPAEKIAQLKAEHRARMARGDKWIYLFFNPAKPEKTFLGRCPSPGYYAALLDELAQKNGASHLGGFEGVAHSAAPASKVSQTPAVTTAQDSAPNRAKKVSGASAESAPPAQDLAALLAQGTHCPNCGHHSSSFKSKRPTKKGEVTVRCKTPDCESGGTFKWKVI